MNDSVDQFGATAETRPARTRHVWRSAAVAIVMCVWLLTGFFVVGGDETATVRVCGRVNRTEDGTVVLRPSGLYWHLPWPFTQIDRVRVNEVRVLTIGTAELDGSGSGEFLQTIDPSLNSRSLTGDRNILHVQINVEFRVLQDRIDEWLYSSTGIEERLHLLGGAVLSDVVLRSGVDFVHTLGHRDIRRAVLIRLRELVADQQFGIEIEDVTIASVAPPLRVKQEFVDVMNARADRETYINRARAYAEQRNSDALAQAEQVRNEAQSYRRRKIDLAKAEADSFNRMIDQLQAASVSTSIGYAQVRRMALRRRYIETLEEVYRTVEGKVFLDSGQPIDLTIHRNPAAD